MSAVDRLPDADGSLIGGLSLAMRSRRDRGLGYLDKSPIFWSVGTYRLSERLLGAGTRRPLEQVADLIPAGAGVTDLCCGPADLYTKHLRDKRCPYVGLDFNGHFRRALRREGVDYRFIRLPDDSIPPADFVVMCSSFYHFRNCEDELLTRMKAAARKRVVISEPTSNLTNHSFRPLARVANLLTAPGVGDHAFRHNAATFADLAHRHDAIEVRADPEGHHAIAIFEGAR